MSVLILAPCSAGELYILPSSFTVVFHSNLSTPWCGKGKYYFPNFTIETQNVSDLN